MWNDLNVSQQADLSPYRRRVFPHPPNTPHETEFIKHIKRFGHG
jgi:hypothetical protein